MASVTAQGMSYRFHSFIIRNWVLLMLGAALTLGLAVFLYATDMQRDTSRFEIFFYVPFGLYAIAVYWTYRTRRRTGLAHLGKKERHKVEAGAREALYIILVFAIIFRAVFVPTVPTLSDDVYRFYWDGKVAANGVNPYQYAPNAVELDKYQDANWDKINNKDVSSPYPPFSQMTFMVGYLLYPSVQSIYVFKTIATIFDVLTVIVLFQLLRGFGLDPRLSLLYAWSPLAVIEFAHAGHNDSMAIFFMVFSFLALQRGNRMTSAACLALGALTKIFPLLFAPVMFRAWGKKGTALFLGLMALFYLPYIGAGSQVLSGLSVYTDRWLFNGSIFPTVLRGLLESGLTSGSQQAMFIAKIVVAVPFVLALGYLVHRSRKFWFDTRELFKYAFLLVGLFLLLTSTVEPWYVLWVVPFLCVFLSPSWVLFSGSAVLSYYIYIRYDTLNIWQEDMWVRLLEYLPFLSLLAFEVFYLLGSRAEKSDRKGLAHPSRGAEEE